MRRIQLTLISIFLSASIYAQSIKGRVEDEKKVPMVGATVIIEGTKKGTITNENGLFEIKLEAPSAGIYLVGINNQFKKVIIR